MDDLPVDIPAGETLHSPRFFITGCTVVPTQPGVYRIDGFVVTYRWGPLSYTAKITSMKFELIAK